MVCTHGTKEFFIIVFKLFLDESETVPNEAE
jgi:hypothetical protein